ncbi:hypothetical protein CEXT_2101 [Caerostris extrusa]|uniref:Uncharacterized protein n=1 Tax=Caerostris extrusa TaxID=172846 RepID=A0AAV4UZ60_CAEEX|nr:hypothetical protein CEXT_2101 [Caerostris extrusa]
MEISSMEQIVAKKDFISLHDFGLQAHLHFCQFELTQSEKRGEVENRHPKYSNWPYFPPPNATTVSGEERAINTQRLCPNFQSYAQVVRNYSNYKNLIFQKVKADVLIFNMKHYPIEYIPD